MNHIIKQTLFIEGMTCHSCETRITKRLKTIQGVTQAEAEYQNSKVQVTYDIRRTNNNIIIKAIEELGYTIRPTPQHKRGSNVKQQRNSRINFTKLLFFGVMIYLIYLTFQNLELDFLPRVNQNMGYGILFIVGMLTSLHCIAMCGGINLSQCVTNKFDSGHRNLGKLKPSILYNTGRVISYTLIGGLVGGIGSVVSFSGWAKGIVAIFAGILMVIMGLNMLNIFPALRKFNPGMPRVLSRLSGQNGKRGPFYVGLFNGLMPCGPLQTMQIYALGTGSVIVGATSMFFFSLGTVPLIFGLGAVSSFLSSNFTQKMMKMSAVLVIILGIIMLNRGLGLSGIAGFSASPETTATIKENIQTVITSLDSGNYSPITIQKGIPVKWTIQVDSNDLNGCNSTLTIPKYNYTKELRPGENIIEFFPEKEGKIIYTCSMGMIRSNITVVDDLANNPIFYR